MLTSTGRIYPVRDRQTGDVIGARGERGRPLWPWERAANERTIGPWRRALSEGHAVVVPRDRRFDV